MIRYILLFLPYLLQLLCIVHVVKTRRETYWIWIIIMIPYVGGIGYALVELLPSLVSRRKIEAVQDRITVAFRPGKKLSDLKDNAAYSPTLRNMMTYADELAARGDFAEALRIYLECRTGIMAGDPILTYKISHARYKSGDYEGAFEDFTKLPRNQQGIHDHDSWNSLYLLLVEQLREPDFVTAEYERACALSNRKDVEFQYLEYLARKRNFKSLESRLTRIYAEEASMKQLGIGYDRGYYRKVHALEKSFPR